MAAHFSGWRVAACAAWVAGLLAGASVAFAQSSEDKGGETLAAKCLQCHSDGMWRDQRQDRRAWEATLFRMVGRGATWEIDEIKSMADYLGENFGPNAPKAAAPAKKQ